MARNPSEVDQVVARTLRDSLAKLQQTTEELDQAVSDLVSACASARPSNSLPPMLRARSAAASLSASLEVMAKFVMTALHAVSVEQDELVAEARSVPVARPEAAAESSPVGEPVTATMASEPVEDFEPGASDTVATEPVVTETLASEPMAAAGPADAVTPPAPAEFPVPEPVAAEPALSEAPVIETAPALLATVASMDQQVADAAPQTAELYELATWQEPAHTPVPEPAGPEAAPSLPSVEEVLASVELASSANPPETIPASTYNDVQANEELPPEAKGFNVLALAPEQQELHRRANRVAKVSMQDVKMLRPRDVALGKEHKDICIRLRDDIEKAHKEYDRRFHAILDHPVDYFYDWMVEILGDGDPETLGEYPYPSPVLRR